MFSVITSLCLIQCSAPASTEDNSAATGIIEKLEGRISSQITKYNKVLFLPSTGCNGCISSTEDFVINSYVGADRHDILVVITGWSSMKDVKMRFGPDVAQYPDVYVDLSNDFSQPPFFQQYPKVVYLRNGEVTKVAEISPNEKEDVFSTL